MQRLLPFNWRKNGVRELWRFHRLSCWQFKSNGRGTRTPWKGDSLEGGHCHTARASETPDWLRTWLNFSRLKTRGEGQARSHENKSDMNGVSLLVVGHHQHRSRTVNESRLGRSVSFSSKATARNAFLFYQLKCHTRPFLITVRPSWSSPLEQQLWRAALFVWVLC